MGIRNSLGKWLFDGSRALGYDAAMWTRGRQDRALFMAPDQDEDSLIGKWDRSRLRQECMDLRRNNAIVAGVVERFADNVVGSGILPQAKTSSAEWNKEAEMFWLEWSKICDGRNRLHMRDLQRLSVQMRLTAGELGFVLQSNGQIYPVEAERIVTPANEKQDGRVVEGVRLAPSGVPVAYYIGSRDKSGLVNPQKTQRIAARDFVHLSRAIRFDQVRGIPDLAPVVNALRDFGELNESTIRRAKMDSMLAWFIPGRGDDLANLGRRNGHSETGKPITKLENNMVYYGREGEGQPQSFASNTPNPQYVQFVELILRIMGSALGLPYEFLLLDFSQGSFSSSRAALLQTYRTFTSWQEWLTAGKLQRIWNWRIAKAIKESDLPPAPLDARGVSEWYKVQWSYPEYGWVDPQAQAQADLLEFQMGKQSLSSIVKKTGKDAEDVLTEKGNDIAAAIRIAAELNATHGTSITWQDLIQAQIPGQVTKGQVQEGQQNGK